MENLIQAKMFRWSKEFQVPLTISVPPWYLLNAQYFAPPPGPGKVVNPEVLQ
jgi:hypothetical protein